MNIIRDLVLEELREVVKVVGNQSKELAILNERLIFTNKNIDTVVETSNKRWSLYIKSMVILAFISSFNLLDKDVLKLLADIIK